MPVFYMDKICTWITSQIVILSLFYINPAVFCILSNEMADALSDVCARTHPVGGLLLRLVAAVGRLARGLAAGGGWGGQERWLLAKRRPFYHPNPVTKKGQPFNG